MEILLFFDIDTMERWRKGCDHHRLTRIYDHSHEKTCPQCGRVPYFGWFYKCTVAYDGTLPETEFNGTHPIVLNRDADLYTLSPSVMKAAEQGHYTAEELEVLWQQKTAVRRAVQMDRPKTSSTISSDFTSPNFSVLNSSTFSTVQSLNTEPGIGDELAASGRRLPSIKEVQSESEYENAVLPQVWGRVQLGGTVPCNFMCCDACGSKDQEKSFQSLNKIVDTPYQPIPPHDYWNRPIDKPILAREIKGVKVVPRFYSTVPPEDIARSDSQKANKGKSQFSNTVQRLLRRKSKDQVNNDSSDSLAPFDYEAYLNTSPDAYSSASMAAASMGSRSVGVGTSQYPARAFEDPRSIFRPLASHPVQQSDIDLAAGNVGGRSRLPTVPEQVDEEEFVGDEGSSSYEGTIPSLIRTPRHQNLQDLLRDTRSD